MNRKEQKQIKEQRKLFDRFVALQSNTEWTMHTTVEANNFGGLLVKVDLVTSPALAEIQREFEEVYLNSDGIRILR